MTRAVDVFWSHQSPYCYFALDRILALKSRPGVEVTLRPVLPGVLRNPEVFSDATDIEERYFLMDVKRTADFLGLPYGEAAPYPVEFQPGTLFRAARAQPRISKLYHLTAAACQLGQGWAFLDVVTRLIWDGRERDWDRGDKLEDAMERAGLDYAALSARARDQAAEYDLWFAENHEALLRYGHWGVPTFVFEGEPFFGQDRFDQLLWRMGLAF